MQSSLSFPTWSGDGRWKAAALGPCTSRADLQGQTSSWDLDVNSNQRACLLFGTVRTWLALESLRNNLCLYHTRHSLEGMSSFPFAVAHWAVGCKPSLRRLEPSFSLCISHSFAAYGNHRVGTCCRNTIVELIHLRMLFLAPIHTCSQRSVALPAPLKRYPVITQYSIVFWPVLPSNINTV